MAEYIELEAVIEKNHGGVVYIDDIKSIPAADVAPVRHGRWIKDGVYYSCSQCGRSFHYRMEPQWWHGCPNCLTKMDGGAE